MEILGAEHVPQGGGGQQPGGLVGVLHVDHGVHRVEDLEIDDSVNSLSRNSLVMPISQSALYIPQ